MKVLLAVLLAVVLFMPTALPALAGSLTVTDVKELAGTWVGYGRSTYGSARVATQLSVQEDGTYTASAERVTQGKIELVNGRLMYNSDNSSGTMTLEERGGKQMLTISGTLKRTAQPITGEYVRTK